jgi:tetratricopeptide (TPR) repeat protein
LIFFLLLFFLPFRTLAQTGDPAAEKLSQIKRLYDVGNWDAVVRAAVQLPVESADLLLYRGLALAHLQRWEEAKAAFATGREKAPGDPRFLIELAGISYREKDFSKAKRDLGRALTMNPKDEYANNFLASIYFQEGNLEAALKYWNRAGKPKLEDLTFEPALKLRPLVVDRAFAFARGGEWQREQYLTTQARLRALDLYPGMFFELRAHDDGRFDLGFHAAERNGWGSSKWEGLVSLLRDTPYQAVDPGFYNLGRAGVNWVSTYRWDDEKRRVFT